MDRLSELARDVRRAAVEVVARVELMVDAAPKDLAAKQAFLLDVRDAVDDTEEAAGLLKDFADDLFRAVK